MEEEFEFKLVRLLKTDGTWQAFADSWRAECEDLGEDFDGYAEATFSVVEELIDTEQQRAGVFALDWGGKFPVMCQINKAPLPKYDSPVLRVRFITLSPEYDLTEKTISEYGDVLVDLLGQVLGLAYLDGELKSRHIKFHLRSPSDQQFFRALGLGLSKHESFESIETRGAWLYISMQDDG